MTEVTLRRYTNLSAALHVLRNKCLTLLNPATWDDRNDAYFMSAFKTQKGARTVLAICFAEDTESYHHWRVFSHGTDGVCIELDKDALTTAIATDTRMIARRIEYMLIEEAEAARIPRDDLPFKKRKPYAPENEFRIIYIDYEEEVAFKHIPISLDAIRRITLSPWMHWSLAKAVKDTIRGLDGCAEIIVSRSTLIENERWKKIANPTLKEEA